MGSGGGFPVIILAILLPQYKFAGIESKLKKTNFLNMVKQELLLNNLTIYTANVNECLAKISASVYTAKAFKPYNEVIKLLKKFSEPNAFGIIPISKDQFQEIQSQQTKQKAIFTLINQDPFYYIKFAPSV